MAQYGWVRRRTQNQSVNITDVGLSRANEFNDRRKRYSILMAGRVICVLLAVVGASYSLWLSLALFIASGVLPWCAVLIANDRPRKRRYPSTAIAGHHNERALPTGTDSRVVDD